MSFNHFLKSQYDYHSISRKDCIAKLNIYHEEFSNLDSVTFSRWITGKTTPSLFKQILICVFFEYDLYNFIRDNNYTISKQGNTLYERTLKTFKKKEISANNISYYYDIHGKSKYYIKELDKTEHRNKFFYFYLKFETYKKIFNLIDKENLSPITISFEEINNNNIISHDSISYIERKNKILVKKIFNLKNDLDDLDDFWFANLAYQHSELTLALSYTLLTYFMYMNKKTTFLSLFRDEDTFQSYLEVGYKQIPCAIIDNGIKLYLTKCNIFEIISHPFVIRKMNAILNEYDINSFFSQEIKDKYFKR
ncbi:hypothetical protein ACPV34_07510 [Photobacterium damselae]|uniref:hypothetical protein n=1 Tax=Photobacterium damselae TaxID=38293 RepID=UPI0040692847